MLWQAGGGGAKAQARNLLVQTQAAAKANKTGGAAGGSAADTDSNGAAEPSGPDPRLQAPKRQPVTVSQDVVQSLISSSIMHLLAAFGLGASLAHGGPKATTLAGHES